MFLSLGLCTGTLCLPSSQWLQVILDIKLQASQPTTVTCKVSCHGIVWVFRRRIAKLCQATIASLSIISWECAPTWCIFAPAGQSLLLPPAIGLWLWWYWVTHWESNRRLAAGVGCSLIFQSTGATLRPSPNASWCNTLRCAPSFGLWLDSHHTFFLSFTTLVR